LAQLGQRPTPTAALAGVGPTPPAVSNGAKVKKRAVVGSKSSAAHDGASAPAAVVTANAGGGALANGWCDSGGGEGEEGSEYLELVQLPAPSKRESADRLTPLVDRMLLRPAVVQLPAAAAAAHGFSTAVTALTTSKGMSNSTPPQGRRTPAPNGTNGGSPWSSPALGGSRKATNSATPPPPTVANDTALEQGQLPRKEVMQQLVRSVVPKLTSDLRKGQCGRIGVFGGCILYTGAPYFAAISGLKAGADLVHVFCEQEAGQVIKSYSPELIVHPVLDTEYVLEEIDQWLPRLHCAVIGPGLGRNQSMLGRISIIMDKIKTENIPVVIDADGLWHLTNNPLIIKGYRRAVLTPNAVEFSRLVHSVLKRGDAHPTPHPDPALVAEVATALGGVTIVHKGSVDVISNGKFTEYVSDDGCPRRCGGQGDLLSGSLAPFLFWAHQRRPEVPDPGPSVVAGWAAARLSRACAAQAFSQHGRATTTTDLIAQIESAFSRLFESETCL